MIQKIKKSRTDKILKDLKDVRNIGMIAFGIIALLVTWSSVKVVQTNYGLQKQISAFQQQNEVARLANDNLRLKNQYYNTDQYLELAARKHFNKASPGEKLLIVPKETALAHTIEAKPLLSQAETKAQTTEASGSSFQNNFNAWLDFLFHRQTN